MSAEPNEQPVEVLVGMVEAMLKRSEQYRREAEADGDINDGDKHARVSSVLKEIVRLGRGLAAAAAKSEQPSSANKSAFDSTELVGGSAKTTERRRWVVETWRRSGQHWGVWSTVDTDAQAEEDERYLRGQRCKVRISVERTVTTYLRADEVEPPTDRGVPRP